MQRNLTEGPITKNILLFALPLMVGNLLQQLYNIADTWVVGRFLGANALAAVGSSYTFMTFLTSIFIGLCMGSGSAISMQYGEGDSKKVRQSVFISFVTVAIISIILNIVVYLFMDFILKTMQVPIEIRSIMKQYLEVIFLGIIAIFLYNYFANLLRAIGNSVVPLVFLAISSIINILLDILCVLILKWGVRGAAIATVFSQYLSAIGIIIYTFIRVKEIIPRGNDMKWDKQNRQGNYRALTILFLLLDMNFRNCSIIIYRWFIISIFFISFFMISVNFRNCKFIKCHIIILFVFCFFTIHKQYPLEVLQ